MGLDSVYKHLREVFPTVDARVLRAVAIENSKDSKVAEKVVLEEIIPFLSAQSVSIDSGSEINSCSSKAAGADAPTVVQTDESDYQNSSRESADIIKVGEFEDSEVLDESSLNGDVALSLIQNVLCDGSTNSVESVMVPVTPITREEPEPSYSYITVSKNDIPPSEMVGCETECTINTMADPEAETPSAVVDKPEPSKFTVYASEEGLATPVSDDFEGETNVSTTIRSQYEHIYSTQHLEDIIESARSEKITLQSAKESLYSLIKEVELKENSIEQAKEEAARGGLSILANVKELKQMLQRAKEANDMNAGEVYGEKSILATEVRELQSRLVSMSVERKKALAMLDEMRLSLEVRLEEAERDIKAAEQERLDKEEFAHKSLAYEKGIMEKVVQESKILEQEAEKNSELREFLMDRGRLVDIIQGEISVVCQDIKLIKEKFDQHVPLSKLLSSSYTLASLTSSGSSVTSTAPRQLSKLVQALDSTKALDTSSIANDQILHVEEVPSHQKELIDDGWEFFDKEDCST